MLILLVTTLFTTIVMLFGTEWIVSLAVDQSSSYFGILVDGTKILRRLEIL